MRLLLWAVPFRHLAPWLGTPLRLEEANSAAPDAAQLEQARRLGRLVQLAARHTPWQSACLAQALTAKFLLERRRIPATLYFGAAFQQNRQLEAHAWVTCGPVYVTGGDVFERYQVVSAYGTSQPQPPEKRA